MKRVAMAAALVAGWSVSAYAEPMYSTVYVFGDSLSGMFGRLNGGIAVRLTPGITVTLDGDTTIGRNGGNEHSVMGAIRVRL